MLKFKVNFHKNKNIFFLQYPLLGEACVYKVEPITRHFPYSLVAGEQQLHIVGQREGETGDFHDKNLSKPRGNHFAMRVSSCKEVDEMLKSKGVDYFPPKKRPDGAIQIFIKDPDGYFVELTEISWL